MCVCGERQIERIKGEGEMRRHHFATVTFRKWQGSEKRARASQVNGPLRYSRTSEEMGAARREGESRVEVERCGGRWQTL